MHLYFARGVFRATRRSRMSRLARHRETCRPPLWRKRRL